MKADLLPAKHPLAIITVPFDFGPLLVECANPATAEVVSATVTATLFSGTDPTPSAILALAPDLSQAPTVLQRIVGGVDGASYLLTGLATTNSGEVIVLEGLLPVSS
jgi:hypothetical protein